MQHAFLEVLVDVEMIILCNYLQSHSSPTSKFSLFVQWNKLQLAQKRHVKVPVLPCSMFFKL